ncbi:hypothetical protein HPB47_023405, partial [Ixodes persulcatus]
SVHNDGSLGVVVPMDPWFKADFVSGADITQKLLIPITSTGGKHDKAGPGMTSYIVTPEAGFLNPRCHSQRLCVRRLTRDRFPKPRYDDPFETTLQARSRGVESVRYTPTSFWYWTWVSTESEASDDAFANNPFLTLLALDGNPMATIPLEPFRHLNSTLRGISIG